MRTELHDFDIYPLVFLKGREEKITICSREAFRRNINKGLEYILHIAEVEKADDSRYPGTNADYDIKVLSTEENKLSFTINCPNEGMYFITLKDQNNITYGQFRLYALNEDMKGRYPYRGDLHMHTCRSDGHDSPEKVVSDYRFNGYDFTVISDHNRYYPSLEARRIFKFDNNDESPLTDLLIVLGEEVHLPKNPMHYVNFGGRFSINALVTPTLNDEQPGILNRSLNGECPEPISEEEYLKEIKEIADKVDLPLESERMSYASMCWIYNKQKEAKGLGIFPHPYWLCSTMHLSESFTKFVYEQKQYDAFEVLGGENYYQHNGFQTALYYEMKAKGIDVPVVGSTDSHGSTENNRNALICSTIVFSKENKTDSLVDAIKEKYSVAVDSISKEYRLVGDFRWIKYGSFLLENWFPIHDLACKGEGYYMHEYALGNEKAISVLKAMKGQVPSLIKKYFEIQ